MNSSASSPYYLIVICCNFVYNICVTRLCPECHYIGKGNFGKFLNNWLFGDIKSGIGLIIVGIFYTFFRWADEPFDPFTTTITVLGTMFGVFCVIQYYRGGKICPRCNYTPMLPLDNPEAINLIKKNDLTLGDNPPPTPQQEPNPDLSNPTKS